MNPDADLGLLVDLGLVVPCEDEHGSPRYVPTARARMLARRILLLRYEGA